MEKVGNKMEHKLDKQITKSFLQSLHDISFKAILWDGEELIIGEGKPEFEVILKEPLSKSHLLRSTTLELGEAYMNKTIEVNGELYVALDRILSQMEKFSTHYKAFPKLYQKSNTMSHNRENIAYHYDLGNEFYSLWLDDTMSYSCAYFESEEDTLNQAQCNKINYILKKLHLQKGQKLLDIGCGWGDLLIQAAKQYGVSGYGITLSEEQRRKCQEKIKAEGLEKLVQVKIMDYQELQRSNMKFQRIVSVGMIEHVGRDHYASFFENVDHVLDENGIMLLHFINGMKESKGDAWIKKYIFPGGVIPSLREIVNLISDKRYHILDIESLRPHYVRTLLCWYNNFNDNLHEVAQMFDETFIRMWRLYLASCAAGFHNGIVDLHQIVFTKGVLNDLPLTRDDLYG